MDPFDYFIYEQFFDPRMKYECQQCGTSFGDECVTWDETMQCRVVTCPIGGSQGLPSDQPED